jgi:superfamily I DNA and/or RNA helicase
MSLPDVVGLRKNVLWLSHDNLEDRSRGVIDQGSYTNRWEVKMTHVLLRHIIRQREYCSNDIAVLTPHTGQLQKLRSRFQKEFEIVLGERDQEALDHEGFTDNDDTRRQHSGPHCSSSC